MCMNKEIYFLGLFIASLFGCKNDAAIIFPPLNEGGEIVGTYQLDEYDQPKVVIKAILNGEENELASIACSGNYIISNVRQGRDIFFLRNKRQNSETFELWRCNADTGRLEYITFVSGIYAVSASGRKLVSFIEYAKNKKPPRWMLVRDLSLKNILEKVDLFRMVAEKTNGMGNPQDFWPFVTFDEQHEEFLVKMDQFSEDGPLSFIFTVK